MWKSNGFTRRMIYKWWRFHISVSALEVLTAKHMDLKRRHPQAFHPPFCLSAKEHKWQAHHWGRWKSYPLLHLQYKTKGTIPITNRTIRPGIGIYLHVQINSWNAGSNDSDHCIQPLSGNHQIWGWFMTLIQDTIAVRNTMRSRIPCEFWWFDFAEVNGAFRSYSQHGSIKQREPVGATNLVS